MVNAPFLSAHEAARAAALEAVPAWYSPIAHLALNVGVPTVSCIISICMVRGSGWLSILSTTVVTLFLANLFEWFVHKQVMHRPRKMLRSVYALHARRHHAIYLMHDMAIRDRREWLFVLISAGEFVGLMVIVAMIAGGAGALLGNDIGCIVLAVQMAYIAGYELTHLSYHLPKEHGVRRLFPFITALSDHHAVHHDLGLMGAWNFNVTVPFMDILLRTRASRELVATRKARQQRQ